MPSVQSTIGAVDQGVSVDRRAFLRSGVVVGGAAVVTGAVYGTPWSSGPWSAPRETFAGPYGSLLPVDANGIELPPGFSSRLIAVSGRPVGTTSYRWHDAPDGGACFATEDGWIYVSNSEVEPGGGVSAIRFDSSGALVDAYRTLSGTRRNCAGGATPWNTWLSCEEVPYGYVYETDPWGVRPGRRCEAMGRFMHEAAACDPVRRVIYLTEDRSDGCFYRFRPRVWGDLSQGGTLEVLVAGAADTSGTTTWVQVPDPTPSENATPTRKQVDGAKRFDGGEGCHYADGTCWFTTKGDGRVWYVNAAENSYGLTFDPTGEESLDGVDNLTASAAGDLYVAEDMGNMEINIITPDDVIAPVLRVNQQDSSELCGPAFNPAGDRLYFSSQRGIAGVADGGLTYEITGPFRR